MKPCHRARRKCPVCERLFFYDKKNPKEVRRRFCSKKCKDFNLKKNIVCNCIFRRLRRSKKK